MEIKPQWGFGKIKFGLAEKEVLAILGAPTLREVDEDMDEPADITLEYESLGVDLTFSGDDDYRLGAITFYAPDYTLNGVQFINLTEKQLLKSAQKAGISELELEEDSEDPLAKNYVSEEKGLLFWIQEGIVDSISMLPEYDDDGDDVIWPK